MQIAPSSVLVLAPHTDDGELGCGATIAKLLEGDAALHYVAFSTCAESVPEPFSPDVLAHEVQKATQTLGIQQDRVLVKDYRVRRFPEKRQEILEDMVALNREIAPDLVFAPSSFDTHQDHQVVFEEARRAFKRSSILGYEFMWNNYSFGSTMFCVVSEGNIESKIVSLKEYESQAGRFPDLERLVTGQANFRGLQIAEEYAEAFEVIRWIIR